jgi:hypothetical protein
MRAAFVGVFVVLASTGATPVSPVARERGTTHAGVFLATAFARRAASTEELAARFTWPAMTAFQATHARAPAARPIRQQGSEGYPFLEGLPGVATAAPDVRAWEDWTYTTTLLTLSRPLYESWSNDQREDRGRRQHRLAKVEGAMKRGGPVGLAAIREAIDQRRPLDEFGWSAVAAFAQKQGDTELALTILSRHQPVGRCSMDRGPQMVAREYAELCYGAGKLACFLNLQIQIMGDQFQRMVYSSYGEAAHATEAGRLRDIGIDVEKFLRGLLYRFDAPGVERRELNTWRLARSIHEANLGPQMVSVLRAEAARPDLDVFNRLRAADTLASLRYQQATPGRTGVGGGREQQIRPALLREIRAELETLGLPQAARPWIRSWGE